MTKENWAKWQKSLNEVKQIYIREWDNHKYEYYVKPLLDNKCGDKITKVEFENCGKEMTVLIWVQRQGRTYPRCHLLHREWVNKVVFEQ